MLMKQLKIRKDERIQRKFSSNLIGRESRWLRKLPIRKCVGCDERKSKFDLIRIVP